MSESARADDQGTRARLIFFDPQRAPDRCLRCPVRHLGICGGVETDDLERIAAMTVLKTLEKGRTFIAEAEPARYFFNVVAGTAKLVKQLPDGRQQITGFVGPGYCLGLATTSTYGFSAVAEEPMRVCRWDHAKLEKVLRDYPGVQRRLLDMVLTELQVAHEHMLLLGCKTAREKMATFLLGQAALPTHCSHLVPGLADTVRLPMTRSDIGNYLGLALETVSRTLTSLRSDGLIDIPSGSEVTIVDHAGLEKVAGEAVA